MDSTTYSLPVSQTKTSEDSHQKYSGDTGEQYVTSVMEQPLVTDLGAYPEYDREIFSRRVKDKVTMY